MKRTGAANRQLVRNSVDVLALATGRVSIPDLYRLVVSAPTSPEQVRSADWRDNSFCHKCLKAADARTKTPSQERDFEIDADYFMLEYPAFSDKTRSVILSTFTSMVDVLQPRRTSRAIQRRDEHHPGGDVRRGNHFGRFAGQGVRRGWAVCPSAMEARFSEGH